MKQFELKEDLVIASVFHQIKVQSLFSKFFNRFGSDNEDKHKMVENLINNKLKNRQYFDILKIRYNGKILFLLSKLNLAFKIFNFRNQTFK